MYSVVMMAALTTGGAETPAFFFHRRHSCHGCYSACYGCYSSCHGCYSSYAGCSGCWGWSSWRAHRWSHGCYSSCYGCYGACYGSCYGSCYGLSCHGCYGQGYGCAGACYGGYAAPIYQPVAPVTPAPGATAPMGTEPAKDKTEGTSGTALPTGSGNIARLELEIPEGAKLYIDGNLMKEKAGTRRFHTPPLQRGQAYFYDVRVVVERDGETLEQNKRIIVRAGQEVAEAFDGLIPARPRTYVSTD